MARRQPAPHLSGMVITAVQAAEIVGVTNPMITHYVKLGIIPTDANKKITLGGMVQGMLSHLRTLRGKKTNLTTAAKVQEARAKEMNLRISERENRLVDVDEIDQLFTVMHAAIRVRFMGIPNRATRDPELRRIIEMEITDAMAELSDSFLAESERIKNMTEADRKVDREKREKFEEEISSADLNVQ